MSIDINKWVDTEPDTLETDLNDVDVSEDYEDLLSNRDKKLMKYELKHKHSKKYFDDEYD